MFVFIREYIGDHLNKLPFFDKHKIGNLLNTIGNNRTSEGFMSIGETDALIMTIASIVALQEQFGLVLS